MIKNITLLLAALAIAAPVQAFADEAPTPVAAESSAAGEPPNDGDLPPSKSDYDPKPEVASPGMPPGGLVRQAGVGGLTGYGRAGVLELGGAAGLLVTTDITSVQVAPQVGWFIADNLQLSAILNFNYNRSGGENSTAYGILVEPSYHLPFNRTTFGFVGLGMGMAYVEGPGAGFATAPRIGANFLIGRSGILTPSLSYQYTTHSIEDVGHDRTLIGVSQAVRANIGYTIML